MKLATLLVLSALTCGSVAAAALPSDHAERLARGLETFRTQVRPLLTAHCLKCHGGEQTKGELDLATREGLVKGGAEGPVVTLYDSRSSRLLQLVSHAKEPHMPSKADKLPGDAVGKLAAWIDDGAPYDAPLVEGKAPAKKDRGSITASDRDWWAFRPLRPPAVAVDARPRGGRGNAVDVVAASKDRGTKPVPAADRRTLIRRASFDLLGLPPTPEMVEAFERDRAPGAWAKVVDRLLESPRHGERWARHWLDVARFAESSGFEHDYDRPGAYHFRDFVIKALNSDMPYDQFVRWQIAGDEFAPEDPLALMATGFLGAGVFPTQITANEVERTRYDALDDMLATTGTAMLGLTVGCARCHDHKFDPIPARDYYRMLSTFTTTVRSELELDLQPDVTRRAKLAFDEAHAPFVSAEKAYEERELPAKFEAWQASGVATMPASRWELLDPVGLTSKAGTTFRKLDDGSYLAEGKNGDSDTYTFVAVSRTSGVRAIRVEALAHPSLPQGGPGRADNGNIGLSRVRVSVSPAAGGQTNEIKLLRARATFQQDAASLSAASAIDDDPKTGWAVDPKFGKDHAAVFDLERPVGSDDGTRFEVRLEFALNTRHNIGRPRISVTTAADAAPDDGALPGDVAAAIATLRRTGASRTALTATERAALLGWWKRSDPGWRAVHEAVEEHSRRAPKPALTKVLVCAEGYPAVRMHTQGGDFLPETHFLQRGSTDLKRGVATPGFLQVVGRGADADPRWMWQPPAGARFSGRRRTLANWMTDADAGAGHLLARVIVNRLWQHHFGEGLVATPNDLGVQGAKPSHPELLDWLASELIRGGWRLKPVHRLMMESALYQQAPARVPATGGRAAGKSGPMKTDATGKPPGRIPIRLSAEAIRDTLLCVSGVLETNMYGPGSLDQASRRRSIYFTVKRSQMVPAMQAFDAPEPLASQGSRQATTVAPQALMLMNSPQVRSWAEAFARRFAPGPGTSPSDAVRRAYSIALNRPPTRPEADDALAFIRQQTERYQAAQKPDPGAAAFADFAQVVLGLNETIYVE